MPCHKDLNYPKVLGDEKRRHKWTKKTEKGIARWIRRKKIYEREIQRGGENNRRKGRKC